MRSTQKFVAIILVAFVAVGFLGADAIAKKGGGGLIAGVVEALTGEKKDKKEEREKGKKDDKPKHTATKKGGNKDGDPEREKGKKDKKPKHTAINIMNGDSGWKAIGKESDSRREGVAKFGGE